MTMRVHGVNTKVEKIDGSGGQRDVNDGTWHRWRTDCFDWADRGPGVLSPLPSVALIAHGTLEGVLIQRLFRKATGHAVELV